MYSLLISNMNRNSPIIQCNWEEDSIRMLEKTTRKFHMKDEPFDMRIVRLGQTICLSSDFLSSPHVA